VHPDEIRQGPKTVDEYLAIVPEPAAAPWSRVRATIRAAAPPEATENISYGMPMFKYKGMLVGFARFRSTAVCFLVRVRSRRCATKLESFPHIQGHDPISPGQAPAWSAVKKLVKARIARTKEGSRVNRPVGARLDGQS